MAGGFKYVQGVDVKWEPIYRNDRVSSEKEYQGMVTCFTESVSKTGVVCRTDREFEEMTLLDIKFCLPLTPPNAPKEEVWIECSGVVVRCEKKGLQPAHLPWEVAIFFDRISDRHRELLDQYSSE